MHLNRFDFYDILIRVASFNALFNWIVFFSEGWEVRGGTSGFLAAPKLIIFFQILISTVHWNLVLLKPEVQQICLSYWSENFFNWGVFWLPSKVLARRFWNGSLVCFQSFWWRILTEPIILSCWAGELLVIRFLCGNAGTAVQIRGYG